MLRAVAKMIWINVSPNNVGMMSCDDGVSPAELVAGP